MPPSTARPRSGESRGGACVYRRDLGDGLRVVNMRPEHAAHLEALQRAVFPSLADDERFKAEHYRHHLTVFPEGQLVILAADRVVAATSTIRRDFDFDAPDHSFGEIIAGGWLSSHQPAGAWLYGVDVSVHPDWRRRGLGRALYAARQELVWRLGLRGQIAGGMMRGYGVLQDRMTAEEYLEQVRLGAIFDPTLSMQQRVGFELRALLPNHLHDPVCGGYAALIVLEASRDVAGAVRPART